MSLVDVDLDMAIHTHPRRVVRKIQIMESLPQNGNGSARPDGDGLFSDIAIATLSLKAIFSDPAAYVMLTTLSCDDYAGSLPWSTFILV